MSIHEVNSIAYWELMEANKALEKAYADYMTAYARCEQAALLYESERHAEA